DRVVDQALWVDVVAGRQLRVHPVDALRRPDEALPVGVLADLGEDLADGCLDATIRHVVAVPRRAVRTAGVAGDLVGGEVGLTDLGLDLVDEAADVGREVNRAWHLGDGTRALPIADRASSSDPSRSGRIRTPA